MNAVHDSTIAAMFYALPPAVNFARLVSDLDAGLASMPHELRRLTWDCDDVAIFDIDGSRIVLSLAERLPGPRKTCLSVAVGPNDQCTAPDLLADRRASVASLIVSRISQRLPPDEIVWHGVDGVLDAETLDAATDALLAMREAEAMAAADARAAAPGPRQWQTSFERLMARVEAELGTGRAAPAARPAPASAARRAAPAGPDTPQTAESAAQAAATGAQGASAAPEAADRGERARRNARSRAEATIVIANDLPDLPRPALDEAIRLREALYPPAEATPERASMAARIAVGAIGTTLLIVAAPVGGALLTYNVLRGADLGLTARAIALTGAALGLAELPAVQALLAFV